MHLDEIERLSHEKMFLQEEDGNDNADDQVQPKNE